MADEKFNPIQSPELAPPQPALRPTLRTRGNFSAGVAAGVEQTKALGRGVVAAGAAAVGADDFAEDQLAAASQNLQRAGEIGPEITDISDIEELSDFPKWFAGALGQAVPTMTAIAAGGVAALGARQIAGAGVKKAITNRVAVSTGSIATGQAVETGSIFNEIAADPEARKGQTLRELAGISAAGGAIAGGLEALPVIQLFDRFGVGKAGRKAVNDALLKRTGKAAAIQTASEGGTEGLQTVVERATHKFANDNFEVFGEEGIKEILNATAAGAAAGSTIGAISGIPKGRIEARLEDIAGRKELSTAKAKNQFEKLKKVPGASEFVTKFKSENFSNSQFQSDVASATSRFSSDNLTDVSLENQAGIDKNAADIETLRAVASGDLDTTDAKVQDQLKDINTRFEVDEMDKIIEFARSKGGKELDLQSFIEDVSGTKSEGTSGVFATEDQKEDFTRSTEDKGSEGTTKTARPEIFKFKQDTENKTDGFLSAKASNLFSGSETAPTSNDRKFEKLRQGPTGSDFKKVSLREALTIELSRQKKGGKGKDTSEQAVQAELGKRGRSKFEGLRDAAKTKGQGDKLRRIEAAFDPKDPAKFLDNFEVIQETPAAGIVREPNENSITLDELKADTATGRGDVLVKRKASSKSGKLKTFSTEGQVEVTVKGKKTNQNIKLAPLVRRMVTKRDIDGKPTLNDIRSAYTSGEIALEELGIKFVHAPRPTDVVYRHKDGTQVFFNQVVGGGKDIKGRPLAEGGQELGLKAKALRARKDATVQREFELKRKIKAGINVVQNRKLLNFAQAKLKDIERQFVNASNEAVANTKQKDKTFTKVSRAHNEARSAANELRNARKQKAGKQKDAALELTQSNLDKATVAFEAAGKELDSLELGAKLPQNILESRQALDKFLSLRDEARAEFSQKTPQLRGAEAVSLEEAKALENQPDLVSTSEQNSIDRLRVANQYVGLAMSGKLDSFKQVANKLYGVGAEITTVEQLIERLNKTVRDGGAKFSKDDSADPAPPMPREAMERLWQIKLDKSTQDSKVLNKQLGQWIKGLKLEKFNIELVAADNMVDFIYETYSEVEAAKLLTEFTQGKLGGIYLGNSNKILVNPFFNQKRANEVLAHEYGHAIFQETFLRVATEKDSAVDAVIDAFEKWRAENGKGSVTMQQLYKSKKAFISSTFAGDKKLSELSQKKQEYALDFNEWFADNVARTLTNKGKPRNVADALFKKFADLFQHLFKTGTKIGFVPDKSVVDFIDGVFHRNVDSKIGRALDKSADSIYEGLIERFNNARGKGDLKAADMADYLLKTHYSAALNVNRTSKKPSKPSTVSRRTSSIIKGMSSTHYARATANTATQHAQSPFSRATLNSMQETLWAGLTPDERLVLSRSFNTVRMNRKIVELIAPHDTEGLVSLVEQDPVANIIVGYQLWLGGELEVGPQTAGVFANIGKLYRELFGLISSHDQADQVMNAMRAGTIAERRASGGTQSVVQKVVAGHARESFSKAAMKAWGHVSPWMNKGFATADGRMYATGNAGIIKIANSIHARVGTEGIKRTMSEARKLNNGKFMNKRDKILKEVARIGGGPLNTEVLRLLQNPSATSTMEGAGQMARATRTLLREVWTYARANGVDVKDRGKDYFPWVFDPRYMAEHTDQFRELLMQDNYKATLESMANTESLKEAGRRKTSVDNVEVRTREQIIEAIITSINNSEGMGATEIDLRTLGHTPHMAALNSRDLQFIFDKGSLQDKEALAKFFDKNLDHTLQTYISQAVKRAEYVSRFGQKGEKLQAMFDEAKELGASDADLQLAQQYVDASLGTIGTSTNLRLKLWGIDAKRFFGKLTAEEAATQKAAIISNPKAEVINPRLQEAMGAIMIVQNFALLGLATFTSLADVVGIATRSGSFSTMGKALSAAGKDIYGVARGNRSELRKLAESVGTIESHLTNEALEWEYGSTYLSGRMKWVNEKFFRAILLTQYTNFTRIAGLAAGKDFLVKHASGDFNQHSARFLDQLGLNSGDVTLDTHGDLKVLTALERTKITDKATLEKDDRIRTALNRFVDEAILRPNASQRPIWASDPHFMLVFHLKAFMYSFHDRILRRVVSEVGEGNYAPLIHAMGYIPAMLAADLLRDLAANGGELPEGREDWDWEDYIWRAIRRSGVLGLGNVVVDAAYDSRYGGLGYESFAGPTAESATRLDDLFFDADSGRWEAFQRHLPLQNVWKGYMEDAGVNVD